jgi:hypothetical protein
VQRAFGLAFVCLVTAAVTSAHATPAADTVTPSWVCIKGLCIGHSRDRIDYRYGPNWNGGRLSRSLKVPGGSVGVAFYRELVLDYVALDNVKPTNHVTGVGTCDPVFRLPDGVELGTRIPFGRYWKGYKRVNLFEPGPRPGWRRFVTVGGKKVRVTLDIDQGRVRCVSIARVFE